MQTSLLDQSMQGQSLVVSDGLGVDSTAMLIHLHRQGARPTAVVHADTGSEWPETVAYRAERDAWLKQVGFPDLTVVKNPSPRAGHVSLEHNCVDNRTMPSIAYGFQRHSCSVKWKGAVIDRWVLEQPWAQDAILSGMPILRAIGYDNGAADRRRTFRAPSPDTQWSFWYPLQDALLTRENCIALIRDAGVPVPSKSACFFCPATRPVEIERLARTHPNLMARALRMEALASHNFRTVQGLGGSFSWRSFLATTCPDTLAAIDAAYDTGHELPDRYRSGDETWVPKRLRKTTSQESISMSPAA